MRRASDLKPWDPLHLHPELFSTQYTFDLRKERTKLGSCAKEVGEINESMKYSRGNQENV